MNCDICGDEHQTEHHYQMGAEDASVEYVDFQPQNEYVPDSNAVQEYAPVEDQYEVDPSAEYEHPIEPQVYTAVKKSEVAKDFMDLAQAASSGEADVILSAMEKFSKSQLVRFMDITVIGPVLLFWAWRGKLSTVERTMLGLIGAGTVVYNGRNYLKNKQVIQPQEITAIKNELINSKLSGR